MSGVVVQCSGCCGSAKRFYDQRGALGCRLREPGRYTWLSGAVEQSLPAHHNQVALVVQGFARHSGITPPKGCVSPMVAGAVVRRHYRFG